MTNKEKYNHYNHRPKGWEEISEKEFRRIFFMYIYQEPEYRQIFYDEESSMSGIFSAKLFRLSYENDRDLGVAMVNDWKEDKLSFFRFGTRWSEFSNAFANQFRGDNS